MTKSANISSAQEGQRSSHDGKFVILSEAKNPSGPFSQQHRQPISGNEPNQLRKVKLQRTKFVILNEAEGPAFLSRYLDISRKLTSSSGHSERSEESQRTLAAPMQLIPSSHKTGFTRFAKLTWVSRKARPFEGWQ